MQIYYIKYKSNSEYKMIYKKIEQFFIIFIITGFKFSKYLNYIKIHF